MSVEGKDLDSARAVYGALYLLYAIPLDYFMLFIEAEERGSGRLHMSVNVSKSCSDSKFFFSYLWTIAI